jgi:hypothetical protein
MPKYRVLIDMVEHGFVEVEAENEDEATEKGIEESNEGGFIGGNSEAIVIGVELNEEYAKEKSEE